MEQQAKEGTNSVTDDPITVTPATVTIKITFTGLAVFAAHGDEVLVLQPDARQNADRDAGRGMFHLDGSPAAAHVGFLTFDARHLQPSSASGEVVVRFDREEVKFDSMAPGPVVDALNLPDFSRFAPVMQLNPALPGASPPKSLLTRIHLSGGEFSSTHDNSSRMVSRVLTSDSAMGHQQFSRTYAREVTYTGVINAPGVKISLRSLDGGATRTYTLQPLDGEVTLKISNLCAQNPLEWDALPSGVSTPTDDLDFKWLSILFVCREKELIPPFGEDCQVPYLLHLNDHRRGWLGLISNCFPARGAF